MAGGSSLIAASGSCGFILARGMRDCAASARVSCSSLMTLAATSARPILSWVCRCAMSAVSTCWGVATPCSIRISPSFLRLAMQAPIRLALDARQILLAREDALLDEHLDQRLECGYLLALHLFDGGQNLRRLGRTRGGR